MVRDSLAENKKSTEWGDYLPIHFRKQNFQTFSIVCQLLIEGADCEQLHTAGEDKLAIIHNCIIEEYQNMGRYFYQEKCPSTDDGFVFRLWYTVWISE